MLGLTPEEKKMALQYAQNGADFMFVPSTELCTMIAKGAPETSEINEVLTSILLTREPIRMDSTTIVKYCIGNLDSKNSWLLDHGDIKVVPHQLKKPELVKPKEDEGSKKLEENEDE